MKQIGGVAPAQMQRHTSHTAGVTYLPPPSYDANKFVARTDILKSFRERLTAVEREAPNQQVIMLWGVSGLGKTWIMRHLAHELGDDACHPRQKGSYAFLFDFAADDIRRYQTLETLIWSLAQVIKQAIPRPAPLSATEPEQAAGSDQAMSDGESLTEWAAEIILLLQHSTEQYVPICLFDSLDILEDAHFEWFAWFEEHIWMPIARHSGMMLVFAARKEMKRFQQFEMRRRLKRWEIVPFKVDEVGAQLELEHRTVNAVRVGNILYPYSFGHPYATWRLGEGLATARTSTQAFDEHLASQHEQEFADLLASVIEWWFNQVSPAVRQHILVVATLRHFHIRALQLFLAATEHDETLISKPDSHFQQIIKSMLSTDLVYWNPSRHGYIIDPIVRKIINRWLFMTDLEEYELRHRSAQDLYVDWIRENPSYSVDNLVEVIFHSVTRTRSQDGVSDLKVWNAVESILTEHLTSNNPKLDLQSVVTLLEEIKRDDELRDLLGSYYDRLLKHVEDLQSEVPDYSSNGGQLASNGGNP